VPLFVYESPSSLYFDTRKTLGEFGGGVEPWLNHYFAGAIDVAPPAVFLDREESLWTRVCLLGVHGEEGNDCEKENSYFEFSETHAEEKVPKRDSRTLDVLRCGDETKRYPQITHVGSVIK